MTSRAWESTNKREPFSWQGKCPEHGEWINYVHDNCVTDDWERERGKPKPKQLNLWQKTTQRR